MIHFFLIFLCQKSIKRKKIRKTFELVKIVSVLYPSNIKYVWTDLAMPSV